MARKTVYNNLVTPELWEQVNEENKELMEDFLDYLSSIGRSQGTITQYRNDLRIFFTWMLRKCHNKHYVEIKKSEIARFQGFLLNECKQSSSRIKRLRSAVSSMGNYIEAILDDEYSDFRNNVGKIPPPAPNAVREKTIITFDECNAMADKLIENDKPMLACLITVGCYSGLRQQELTRLLVKDFTTDVKMALGGNFYKTSKIKVKGRGDRKEEKYVWKRCEKWLKNWLEYRKDNNITSEYLFCKQDGTKLEPSNMSGFSDTITRNFNIDFYWHSLRHTLPTELSRAGLPLKVCKFLLGHGSLEMSSKYVDIDDSEAVEEFADFFDGKVDNIKQKGLGDL